MRLERAIRTWPDDGSTRAVLARTNRELLPAVVVALRLGLAVPGAADRAAARLARGRRAARAGGERSPRDGEPLLRHARPGPRARAPSDRADRDGRRGAARLGGRVTPDLAAFAAAVAATRARLAGLRRDDAPLTLATAHATKGLEFDHVIVLGMEAGRFPSARAVSQADDPVRAVRGGTPARLRRVDPCAPLADAACYDPRSPSPFLLEAFSPDELGLSPRAPG